MSKKLLIVGGGPAATNAIETIRQFDSESSITLVSNEPAHSRMALPYWLSGQIPEQQTHTGDADYFTRLNVETHFGSSVKKLDEKSKSVGLDNGDSLSFDAILLATGSKPLPLPVPGADLPGVHHLWTLSDTEQVLKSAEGHTAPRVVMIGAGFIGLIVLNAMHKRNWNLTVIERDEQILPRMLDRTAAGVAKSWLQEKDVTVLTGASVKAIERQDGGDVKQVCLESGERVDADIVIVATGVRPNLALVDETSIEHDHGILVDARMQTSVPGVYAAGDCAQGPVRFSDAKEVHAIQPTAVDHGRVAGANMAGEAIDYQGSLSMNVLDVCGLQCASFGRWNDNSTEAVTISNPTDSIYRCLRWDADRLVGAVFAGRANDMGMLTDVGMVKGLVQTGVAMGEWKQYLHENPFDIRRAFVAKKVPQLLMQETTLGRASAARGFRYDKSKAQHQPGGSHQVYVGAKKS